MRPAAVRSHFRQTRRIDGWFSLEAALLFGIVDEIQTNARIGGHLFEIGVHHGKSATLLCAMARGTERVGLCDIFGQQSHNVSGSGFGDRAVCEMNIERLNPGFDRADIFTKPSSALSQEEIPSPVRIFHVDGGHMAEEAAGDLELAASVLHPEGVAILDDPFRPEWPGVTEGALRFMHAHAEFEPVVMGFNKMVLVRKQARPIYESVASSYPWTFLSQRVYKTKPVRVSDSVGTVFYIPSYRQSQRVNTGVAVVKGLIDTIRMRFGSVGERVRP